MRTLLLIILCLLLAGPALAVKTDTLVMINGDHLTCEIKKLEYAKLTVKTDDMGTLSIEWDKIARLTSPIGFQVRTREGEVSYGILIEPSHDGLLAVRWSERVTEIPLDQITGLQQIKFTFWDAVTASVSLGFSYTKATEVTQLNFSTNGDYRGRIHGYGYSFAANITDQGPDLPVYRRWDTDIYHTKQLSGRLWSDLTLGGQRNDELGLQLRLYGGAGAGYRIAESNHLALQANLGANVTREWATEDSDSEDAVEGRIGVSFSMFAYDSPKTDIRVNLDAYPSFTVDGRVRTEASISARREVISDLFVEIQYYESNDNKPPAGAAATSDRGLVFSVGWNKY